MDNHHGCTLRRVRCQCFRRAAGKFYLEANLDLYVLAPARSKLRSRGVLSSQRRLSGLTFNQTSRTMLPDPALNWPNSHCQGYVVEQLSKNAVLLTRLRQASRSTALEAVALVGPQLTSHLRYPGLGQRWRCLVKNLVKSNWCEPTTLLESKR